MSKSLKSYVLKAFEVCAGDEGWERAKFRWRSSLFSLVTLVDHLFLGFVRGEFSTK